MPSIRANSFYNSPEIGQAMANLASAFAPPSGSDVAGYATAANTRLKTRALSDYLTLGPDATPQQRDLAAYAAGLYDPRQGIGARDMEDATKRYGYDLSSRTELQKQGLANEAARYGHDRVFEASRANNADDNQQKLTQAIMGNKKDVDVAMLGPVAAGATRFVPPAMQGQYGVPSLQVGTLSAGAGQTVVAPDGRTIAGLPTDEQIKGAAFRDVRDKGLISDQAIADIALGKETPVQAIDPVTGAARFMSPGEAVRTAAKPAVDVTKQGETAGRIRGEIAQLPSYKNYAHAAPIYQSMLETAGRDTKASDLNLVYGLGKIMDPGSVVREGEMVMVKNTSALPDWLQGAIAQVSGGAALTPDTRAALMREAHSRMSSYEDIYSRDLDRYGGIVDRAGLSRPDVLPSFSRSKQFEPPAKPNVPSPASPATAPAAAREPVKVATPAEAAKLPPGTPIILPDGSQGVVPAAAPSTRSVRPMSTGSW